MKSKSLIEVALIAVALSILGMCTASATPTITQIYDGDTIALSNGKKVRFLQIDTPELSPGECYAEEARSALVSLLKTPGRITLKTDPQLDKVDRYGRLLRYVFIGKTNLNLKLVEIGAAAPYFYRGDTGLYSTQILKAAQKAKAKSIGLWKSCPGTLLTPTDAIMTISTVNRNTSNASAEVTKCDKNYAGCIPIFPPDLDCTEIKRLGLAPVTVIGKDVHRLDRDGDGKGCDR
jgi:endonuclease YncB( thermonuclease family)